MRIEYDPKHDLLNINLFLRSDYAWSSVELDGLVIDFQKLEDYCNRNFRCWKANYKRPDRFYLILR